MQRPAPAGGGIFKDEWWQYWQVMPDMAWYGIYADTAQKTKEQNDYSVFQLWGTSHTGQKYLIDQVRGKWEAPELLTTARAFWNKHLHLRPRHFKIEDKSSGTGLIQTMKRDGIPILGIPRSIDKVTRGYDAAPIIQNGNVFLPQDVVCQAWCHARPRL